MVGLTIRESNHQMVKWLVRYPDIIGSLGS